MKTKLSVSAILALAIAASAGAYLPAVADNSNSNGVQPSLTKDIAIDPKDASAVQERLTSVADKAANHNGYEALVGSFDKATRARLGLEKDIKQDQLNAQIDQFRKDFKDKYNEDYNPKAGDLSSINVTRGVDDAYAYVDLASFPILKGDSTIAVQPPAPGQKAGEDMRAPMNAQICLVRERTLLGNGWRIVIQENVSGQQLCDSLTGRLTAINIDKSAWPADVHTAYTTFAGQFLRAMIQPRLTMTAMNQ